MERLPNQFVSPSRRVDEDSGRAARILVVEHQRHLSRFLQYVLEASGYDVRIAFDGEQALAEVEAFRPDAVLLDPVLPGMSGRELLCSLRANRRHRGLVIVMLLNGHHPEQGEELLDAGANAHCAKPVAPGLLLEKLEELSVPPRYSHPATRSQSAGH